MSRPRLNLLLLAQTPPPHHGQSRMVQRVQETLAGAPDVRLHHVNLRLSTTSEDIGEPQGRKLWALLQCLWAALQVIRRERPDAFYYVPAPGRAVPMLRDLLVLPVVRALVPQTILHWQAVGLSQRVRQLPAPLRWLFRALYARADLSLVQSPGTGFDAAYFASRRTVVLPNGVPDAFPDAAAVIAAREQHWADPDRPLELLYLSNLQREKGVLTAIAAAHRLAEHRPVRLRLAGAYVSGQEREAIEAACQAPGLAQVERLGFADEATKRELLREADVLLFPTRYRNEGFPLVLIEALSAGLPVVTTHWRGIPDLLPPDYPHFVPDQSPATTAAAVESLLAAPRGDLMRQLRAHYARHYTVASFRDGLRTALEAIP